MKDLFYRKLFLHKKVEQKKVFLDQILIK